LNCNKCHYSSERTFIWEIAVAYCRTFS